jgi:DNA-binding MarR family transcriptional regulator
MSGSKLASRSAEKETSKSSGRLPLPSATVSLPALLMGGNDQAFRRMVHTLLAFLARHETVREGHAAAIGLAGIEYTVLISVKYLAAEGHVSVRELADHLYLSGAFVTTVSNKLQKMRLIEKLVDPGDRRKVRLTVTPAGDELLLALRPTQRQVNDVQFDCLSGTEFQQLLGTVERLVESSDRAIALQRYLVARGDVTSEGKPSRKGDAGARRRKA